MHEVRFPLKKGIYLYLLGFREFSGYDGSIIRKHQCCRKSQELFPGDLVVGARTHWVRPTTCKLVLF